MECERCHRDDCNRMDGSPAYSGARECDVAAEGFRRGAVWMLETAKREAVATDPGGMPVGIYLSDVDAALEARGK